MMVPAVVQQLLDEAINNIRNHPNHEYPYSERLQLYKYLLAILEATLDLEKLFIGKLAIETARKVIPIWLEDEKAAYLISGDKFYSNDPKEILQKAEDVLNDKINYDEIFIELCNRFYNGMAAVQNSANERVLCVVQTAYDALEIALVGIKRLRIPEDEVESSDGKIGFAQRDFARYAEVAIALINPGDATARKSRSRYPDKYPALLFDNEKRLEFWEWWLTEAIPHTWESIPI